MRAALYVARAAAGLMMGCLAMSVAACTASATVAPTSSGTSAGCNLNGNVSCSSGSGWTCDGSSAPEDTHPALVCSTNGTGDYCCAASTCNYDQTISCSSGATGYSCGAGAPPPGNQNAALVCSVPTVTTGSAGSIDQYCCYTNTTTATASTCKQDPTVQGCTPNGSGNASYGFSCTGSENPQADFSRIQCSTTGTPGTDSNGAPATLYCCSYQ